MTSRKDTIFIAPQETPVEAPETEPAAADAIPTMEDSLIYAETVEEVQSALLDRTADRALPAIPINILPLLLTRSGRYVYSRPFTVVGEQVPIQTRLPGEAMFSEDIGALVYYSREEVQLDIDGRYPQMAISGTRSGALTIAGHWVASVTKTGPTTYQGPIWYKNGAPNAIPHTAIVAEVIGGLFSTTRQLKITFSGGPSPAFTRTYNFDSATHRSVEFEFDRVSDAVAATSISTHAHPNRPASLPNETLTLEEVYRRAGFNVAKSGGDSVIPINVAGADSLWTDQEMHDAMQNHWSRFANKPQWSLWVLFARMHQTGTSLGGVMFDDIGPNHRQGTAIFSGAFIANAPAGDPAPAAWVQRMRFWTAAHEMGHAFNLAHSWQKAAAGNLPGNPWIPLANEPLARSFMNYPYSVPGGQSSFFADFAYRFSNAELLFMRHAPSRFVQMGNEAWFTNHGFQEAARVSNPDYELRLTVTQPEGRFAYLTPPVVEAALINRSAGPKLVSGARLGSRAGLALIINPEKGDPRQWLPHLRHCSENVTKVLQPGEALYDSIMIGTGRNGWDLADPGRYCIQAVLEVDDQLVYSNQLPISVAPPASRLEETLASDIFTPEVGQVLAVNGSRGMDGVNTVLARALELPDNPIAKLSAVALATPLAYPFKMFEETDAAAGAQSVAALAEAAPQREISSYAADPEAVRQLLDRAMEGNADEMVNAVGHARYLRDAPLLAGALIEEVPTGLASFDAAAERPEIGTAALPVSKGLEARLQQKMAFIAQ